MDVNKFHEDTFVSHVDYENLTIAQELYNNPNNKWILVSLIPT